MSNWIEPVWAVAWKDWLRFSRQPFLIVISVVMPLVFVFLYAIIVPSSATAPVVVALDGKGPEALAFVETLRMIESQEAPYYEIVTTDSSQAWDLFNTGQAFGLIVIPAEFDDRLAVQSAVVELHLNNINSDYSKNLRLRLDRAVRVFSERLTGPVMGVQESTWLARDPAMRDYISTSLLLFACLYSGMVNTGLQIAGEWNDRTVKTLLLAPVYREIVVAGKMLAGLGQSVMGVGVVALTLVTVFNFRPVGSLWALAGVMTTVMLLGAALGAVTGVASKQTLATTTFLIAAAILIFLVSGNEDSMRGLAWNGPIVGLWWLARACPPPTRSWLREACCSRAIPLRWVETWPS